MSDPAPPDAEPTIETPMAFRHVVFSHGQESGPWGRKISALAEVARSEGYLAHSEILRSEEHTSELQSHVNLVCRLLLEKKKTEGTTIVTNTQKTLLVLNVRAQP